jgi:hypothetical protein
MIGAMLCAASFLAGGAVQADPVADIIAESEDFCTSLENGTFGAQDAVPPVDHHDEGKMDSIADASRFACSSMASACCGSGGCTLHAVVDDASWSFEAEGWRMIDWDGLPILLIARDGGWCGGAGAQLCFRSCHVECR